MVRHRSYSREEKMQRPERQKFKLLVNGEVHEVDVERETPLLYVLRNDLGLKGAKFGCGLGQCGTCKVLVDGEPTLACRTPVDAVGQREVLTVEGLASSDQLHPLQDAFIAENAAQCGYCTSGMLLAAKALLDMNPRPEDDEIRVAMTSNLCRCGTYERIFRAVRRASGRPVADSVYTQQVAPGADPGDATVSGELPRSLQQEPALDAWVRVNTDSTITLFTGKVELGQDIRTSVAMIGADELDVALSRIRVVMADTAATPDEGYTVSSMSLETSGNAIRYATAELRQLALDVAYEELEAPIERLVIQDGSISDPVTGRSTSYWALFGGKRLGSQVTGRAQPKRAPAYEVVGHPQGRLDLLAKVTGQAHFVHDLELPDMVHGRVIRPPNYGARLISVEEEAVKRMPGVLSVVRDGSFLGVIAEREEQAVRAAAALGAVASWEPGPPLPPQASLFEKMVSGPQQAFLLEEGRPMTGPVPPVVAPAEAATTLHATYERPYHMHASLGPSAAVAQLVDGKLTLWSHSQGPYPLRRELAQVLGMPERDIHAIHMDGPGCYGHNGADDAALDAALLARALPGRPVALKWLRKDEHAWEPYGAATLIEMQASLNEDGDVIDWNHDVWGYPHSARSSGAPSSSSLLASWYLDEPCDPPQLRPIMAPEVGVHRNATPLYTFPIRRIVKHFLPGSPLRVSALRGLGTYANVFAIESFVDELAHEAGTDPVAFRLRYLDDPRARAVVEAAVDKAGARPAETGDGAARGRGFGFSQYKNRQSYVAIVVDLVVDRETGRIRLERAVLAVDAGQIVNPDGLSNQLEGGFTQAASWTLHEQVTFGEDGITSVDWRTYPILRFREAPVIETVLLNRPGQPFLGVGEGTHGPVPGAIANAVFDAVGVRLRRIPFTPGRVLDALRASDS
jgi:nicotinate dehydrogenase subunit B